MQFKANSFEISDFIFSIGRVESILASRDISVKTHTIRFWLSIFDHIPYITKNGRRYFSDKSVIEFEKIHNLSRQGYKLEGIKNLVKYNKIQSQKEKNLPKAQEDYPYHEEYLRQIVEIEKLLN